MVNESVSLIFLSDLSLLVYRKARERKREGRKREDEKERQIPSLREEGEITRQRNLLDNDNEHKAI